MKPITTLLALAALVALAAAGPASARARCGIRADVTANACFPKHLNGTFSGSDSDYVWSGHVSLTRHREQTIFLYSGTATVSWEHRDVNIGSDCVLTPAHGAFTQHVELQVNRVADHRRGWSYAGSSEQGDTGPEYSECPGERLSNGNGTIDSVFYFGGFTRNLRRFAGEDRASSTNHHAWALRP